MLYRPQQEEGQGLVEYALILVLVAVVVIAILVLLGPSIGNTFSNILIGLRWAQGM
ncbi:MAG: pilus assembly protein [Anaerolineae bacterium]|nr:pilus assembly protein [Anaerolineae bacterium]MDW8171273.1 pilus assembly protein [Anaerolineae bacterium]